MDAIEGLVSCAACGVSIPVETIGAGVMMPSCCECGSNEFHVAPFYMDLRGDIAAGEVLAAKEASDGQG